MAHILRDDGSDLFTWCKHGTPLGHRCDLCRTAWHTPTHPVQTGWECPRCLRVWAPSVLACHHCPEPPAFIAKGSDG